MYRFQGLFRSCMMAAFLTVAFLTASFAQQTTNYVVKFGPTIPSYVNSLIYDNGTFVALGTTTPRGLLSVHAMPTDISYGGCAGTIMEAFDKSATGSNTTFGGIAFGSYPGYDFIVGKKSLNQATYFQVRRQDGLELLTIDASGNTGIGTTAPGTAKLAVEGKIQAREVVVTSTNPFPDYVFDATYRLLPLDSLDARIKATKRLPDMPSAQEVGKSGMNLGDLQIRLLKKVEELSLYVIALHKENSRLKSEIEKLHK